MMWQVLLNNKSKSSSVIRPRLLFVYGNQQKRVEFSLEDEESGACVKGIKERACRIFNLQNAHVKLWDRGFEDWCDPDNDQEIVENNTKVLITEEEAICTSAPTVPSTLSSPCGFSSQQLPTEQQNSSSQLPSGSLSWIMRYKIPEFSSNITHKLEKGELLREGERSAILEAIYSSVKTYTFYPTSAQYNHIISLLFKRFSKLDKQADMALDNARTLWKYRLQYKFANSRRRDDHEVQIVIRHKRKGNQILPVSHIGKKQPPQWGIANYQPSRPSSEDDASIKAHILWMQQETSKRKPNCERIKLAMSMTLSDRRQLINKEGASVLKIQQTYPWLFDEDEMQNEFQRLTGGSEGPRDLLQAGLQKYEDPIIKIFRSQKKKVPYVESALEAIGLQREEKSRRETANIAAALAVPFLLKEQIDDLIILGDDIGKGFAVIQGDGDKLSSCETFNLIIDGIADTPSTSTASRNKIHQTETVPTNDTPSTSTASIYDPPGTSTAPKYTPPAQALCDTPSTSTSSRYNDNITRPTPHGTKRQAEEPLLSEPQTKKHRRKIIFSEEQDRTLIREWTRLRAENETRSGNRRSDTDMIRAIQYEHPDLDNFTVRQLRDRIRHIFKQDDNK